MSNRKLNAGPVNEMLDMALLIVARCRREGWEARQRGEKVDSCPNAEELERAGWLDGFTRPSVFGSPQIETDNQLESGIPADPKP